MKTIFHVSTLEVTTETFEVATPEEAVQAFVAARGFDSIAAAAEWAALTEDEYRQSLVIDRYDHEGNSR